MLDRNQRKRLLVQLGGKPQASPASIIVRSITWEIVGGFALVLGFLCWVLAQNDARTTSIATLAFVVVGWVFSLCLHEFTHAATALCAGDDSESTRRYLSFNPLHYVHPVLSIVMPLIFIVLGGIGLPGGAVYLQHDRVHSRTWQSLISLGAPVTNLLLAALLGVPLRFGLLDAHPALAGALGALAFFEAMAGILNLLPLPPLDGFGVLAPWLPADIRDGAYSLGAYPAIVLFLVLWYVQPVSDALDLGIFNLLYTWGIDPQIVVQGLTATFFWQH